MKRLNEYGAFVYFTTNKNGTVLYVGVTNDLRRRALEHKEGKVPGFTARYNLVKLVYYECFSSISEAIDREKKLKRWRREWKEKLIEEINPEWRDLMEGELGMEMV